MSLINDALKQAQQTPPRPSDNLLPLHPAADASAAKKPWLIPSLVIAVILVGIFFTSWSKAHRTINDTLEEANAKAAAQPTAEVIPDVKPEPPPPATEPTPIKPAALPKLQGIFYSPTTPSAIMDGKTIRPGDHFKQYRVKEITRYTVTLIGPDGQPVEIGIGN